METTEMTIREYLEEHGALVYHFSGVSMLPMLRQKKDLVLIRRYDGQGLHKYDVALYDRGDGKRLVLHRVVEVHDGYYTFLGDNCYNLEKGIPERAIVGVMEAFYRGGKKVEASSPFWQAYARVWYFLYPVRRFRIGIRIRLGRRLSKIPFLKRMYRRLKGRLVD